MQRLEVSGAVRPIYGSLGVKRLIKPAFSWYIYESYPNLKFHGNGSSGSRVPCGRMDGQTDRYTGMTKQILALRNSVNAPKNVEYFCTFESVSNKSHVTEMKMKRSWNSTSVFCFPVQAVLSSRLLSKIQRTGRAKCCFLFSSHRQAHASNKRFHVQQISS